MQLQKRIEAFAALGKLYDLMSSHELEELAENAAYYNPWFTKGNVLFALKGVRKFLEKENLIKLTKKYNLGEPNKTIGIIMAGNIPLVGFHDLLCVLLSGNKAMVKLSSKDEVLPKFFIGQLGEIAPELSGQISIVDKLQGFDAIIATGSDNTSRYFDYYFGKYPHVIRKNRTSVAVLTGDETTEELSALTDDILTYFGLGCRNVSKVLVPEGYNFEPLFKILEKDQDILHHNKYCNNYDYYKSIYLVNGENFLDTGFIMFKEDKQLVSPVSVVFYEFYKNLNEAKAALATNAEKIQVTVATERAGIEDSVPPGKAQLPEIDDYADRVDTMEFLSSLN